MDIGRLTETLMGMNDRVWDRHANPWSGWSRVAILPVLTLAIWSRVWIGLWAMIPIALCVLWIWLNPRVFPAPADTQNWISRGVKGERVWLNRKHMPIPRHHVRVTTILNSIAVLGLLVYVVGLFQLHVWATLLGIVLMMLCKLWFLDRMVWLLQDMDR